MVDRLLDPLYAARGLARRTGADRGQFDPAILDLLTRQAALTREGGLAALQDYLARRYEESIGQGFFSTEQVNLNAQVVNINGQGAGGQMSTLSGPGQAVPVSDMITRRYQNSRGLSPGLGGVLHW